MMKKIIITGASGFIGKSFFNHFKQNNAVQVETLSLRNNWVLNKNADVLIHLAAKSSDSYKTSDEKEYFEVNRDLTIKLFQAFLDSKIKDFIYFSSAKVITDNAADCLTEETPLNPMSVYGRSKKAAEEYLLAHKLPEGKRLLIIRPCLVHGEGNHGNLIALYKLVKKGLPWFFAGFENKRSFLHIDNLIYCIEKLLEDRNIASGIYNIADDQPISTNELISLMGEVAKKRVRLWAIPSGLVSTAFKVGDILHLPINTNILNKLTGNFFISNQKLKDSINVEKLPSSTQEGLLKTLNSIKDK